MAGSTLDLSAFKHGQPYAGTFSGTPNECDVLAATGIPAGGWYIGVYSVNAARLHVEASGAKTTSSTGADSDAHYPLPAGQWLTVPYHGGGVYLSSATASGGYTLVFYGRSP